MAKDKKDKRGGAQPEEQRAPQVARHSAKETPRLKERFRKEIAPVLKDGMDYLRDNSEEAGCCSWRFATNIGPDGSRAERTFGLGLFLSMGNLEDWSSTHRTHLVIFPLATDVPKIRLRPGTPNLARGRDSSRSG